jgi:hypothetical protein
MIRLATLLAFSVAIGALGQAQQSFLLIPDWDNDRVCAFSPVDGSLINANFIPTNRDLFDSPKHALPTPSGTILVSDQLKDAIHEFDGFGSYIRTVANLPNNGIDNIRGMAIREGKLYVTVGSGTYQNTIQRFNLDGTGQETLLWRALALLQASTSSMPQATKWRTMRSAVVRAARTNWRTG